jgi:xanthine/uracil permease
MLPRLLHVLAAIVFVATIVIQVFLAGAAIGNLGGSGDFAAHVAFGYSIVGLAALLVLVTAIVARVGVRRIAIAAGMLVLYVVQTMLPYAKTSAPWVAALHPVNALFLFGIAIWYVRGAWRDRAAAGPSKPAATPAAPPPAPAPEQA